MAEQNPLHGEEQTGLLGSARVSRPWRPLAGGAILLTAAHAWYKRTAIAPGLTRLQEPAVHPFFRANVFHLVGRYADLVVDAGMGLIPLLPALPLTPGKPVIAVATHIHVDHVGGLHEFSERWGPAAEAPAFATMADTETVAHLFRTVEEPVTRLPEPDWLADGYRIRPAPLTRTLSDGDLVDLGDRLFRVLTLPGHSPGSIGLFDEADGAFFSGDAIYQGSLVDDLLHSDRSIYVDTMRRIAELPVSVVHPGHGDSFGREAMRATALGYVAEKAPSGR